MNLHYTLDRETRDHLLRNSAWAEVFAAARIEARKNGHRTLKCLCPFHREKRPSLVAWDASNRFRCHGCHEEGDRVDFVILFWRIRSAERLIEQFRLFPAPPNPNQLSFPFVDPGATMVPATGAIAPPSPKGKKRRVR